MSVTLLIITILSGFLLIGVNVFQWLDNNKAQNELKHAQEETKREVIGSKCKPDLRPQAFRDFDETNFYGIHFSILNPSKKYSLFGITIFIREMYQIDEGKTVTNSLSFTLSSLPAGTSIPFLSRNVPFLKVGDFYQYLIEVVWRNGAYSDKVRFLIDKANPPLNLPVKRDLKDLNNNVLPTDYFDVVD